MGVKRNWVGSDSPLTHFKKLIFKKSLLKPFIVFYLQCTPIKIFNSPKGGEKEDIFNSFCRKIFKYLFKSIKFVFFFKKKKLIFLNKQRRNN